MKGIPAAQAKVIYVLGAGFSIPAGAPSQARILGEILQLPDSGAQRALRTFLTEDLQIPEDRLADVALEDIYTPLDRCLSDGVSFRSRGYAELGALRGQIESLISQAIDATIKRNRTGSRRAGAYIDRFAEYLSGQAKHRAFLAAEPKTLSNSRSYDPYSIISLNWDILLDNALQEALWKDDRRRGDYDPFGVVDYCCYVSSLREQDTRVRAGLFSLGCKGYNVKLLKLHGSMNWLQCPNCQRLYVDFGEKRLILDQIGKTNCRHCLKNGHTNPLQGSLVMPTFLKDLSNFQVKLVWQNAGVEIMEARRLVFIGYSLPHADFEFRQLLSRMIHRDARVEVVLFRGSSEASKRSYEAELDRYKQFFGQHEIEFHSDGVEAYVERLCGRPKVD